MFPILNTFPQIHHHPAPQVVYQLKYLLSVIKWQAFYFKIYKTASAFFILSHKRIRMYTPWVLVLSRFYYFILHICTILLILSLLFNLSYHQPNPLATFLSLRYNHSCGVLITPIPIKTRKKYEYFNSRAFITRLRRPSDF